MKDISTLIIFCLICVFTVCMSHKVPISRDEAIVALLFYVHGKHLRSCRDGDEAINC